MPKLILEISIALALTAGAAFSLATAAFAGDIEVDGAYARASATPRATSGAIYLRVIGKDQADRLVAVSSPAARAAMLHESRMADGVATMRPVDALDIPAHGNVALSPGGAHIMLTGLAAPLTTGDTIMLKLTFAKAGVIEVRVPVGGVAQDGPPGD